VLVWLSYASWFEHTSPINVSVRPFFRPDR
jgi:hypothetical protein